MATYKLFSDFTYNTAVFSSEWKGPDSAGLWAPLTFLLVQCIRRYSNLLSKLFLKFLLTFKQANCSKFWIIRGCPSSRGINNVTTYKTTNLKALEKQVSNKVKDILATGYSKYSSSRPELNSDRMAFVIWGLLLLSILGHHHKKKRKVCT